MRKYIIVVAASAATLAAPAFAQDSTVTGPRAEVTVGWDRILLHVEDDTDNVTGGKSGVTYGGELGYDVGSANGYFGGFYVGVDGSSTKECLGVGTESACLKSGRNLTAGARVGARFGSDSLAYVKAGYSNGRLQATYTDTAFPADNISEGVNMDGFHVGAGAQIGVSRHTYVKAEYVYTRYSSYELNEDDVRFDRHRVLAGAGVRF